MLDRCLKLHGQICPQEMLPFHETLERLFQKNFSEEILRLPVESVGYQGQLSDAIGPTSPTSSPPPRQSPSNFRSSAQGGLPRKRSESSILGRHVVLPPLQLSKSPVAPPTSPPPYGHIHGTIDLTGNRNQTLLQRNLAHLARYGMNGVSSGPSDRPNIAGSDEHSASSLRDSSVNLNGAVAGHSGVSIAQSGGGGSFRSTLRKFGSLNLGRTSKDT